MDSVKGQLTLRGIVIGCVGCAIITAASVYTALKMGALPWPIVFAAIISLFFLRPSGTANQPQRGERHAHRDERRRHGGGRPGLPSSPASGCRATPTRWAGSRCSS
ncbi:MAG: hypothetical protein ACLTMP_12410 [Eggerthella lenta]